MASLPLAELQSLQARLKLIETEREGLLRVVREGEYRTKKAERQASSAEKSYQSVLVRLKEKDVLLEQMKQRQQQTDAELRLVKAQKKKKKQPPELLVAKLVEPSAPKPTKVPQNRKAPSVATASRAPVVTKAIEASAKPTTHVPQPQKAPSKAPLAAQFEPAALKQPLGCTLQDVCGSGGGGEATIDSVVDCIQCALFRQRSAPSKPALDHGLVAAQAVDLQYRRRHGIPTLWLEFGAWSGRSARVIRNASVAINKPDGVYSFDSFHGLPENWRRDPLRRSNVTRQFLSQGSFTRNGEPPFHEDGITWRVGWFNETIQPFLRDHPRAPISFVHIDCDIYSSTASVFEQIEHRLAPDAVLAFDELVNYPEYRAHELLAFVEYLRRTSRRFRVLGAGARLLMRNPKALRSLLATRQACSRCARPFGGVGSGEDMAIQLVPLAIPG